MENSFQTSFIPKKPITTSNVISSGGSSTSIFTVLSVIILLVAGGSAGGLYLYKGYLNSQIEGLSSSLVKAQGNFDKDTISELELFDKRSSAAKTVLNNHLVLSPMFKLMGDLTIPSIQYTKFDHSTTDKGFTVKMSGVARDYRSVALQADVFNSAKGRSFKNVVFSNLTKDKNNFVLFDLEFNVEKSLLSFENNVSLGQAKTQPSSQNQAQTPVVTPTPVKTTEAPAANVGTQSTTTTQPTAPKNSNGIKLPINSVIQ